MKEIEELRALSLKELQEKLISLGKEQFKLRMKKTNGALDKTHLVSKVRRSIAKLKTIMTEKEVEKGDIRK